MTKFGRLGVALVLSSILAAPAMAKQINRHHPTGAACDPRDPGNPYSRTYDYLAWSAWRKRGSWDDRAEYTCQPIPAYPWSSSQH